MLEPRPQFPEQSVRVQAVVSDWGADKLWDRRQQTPQPWLSPDDPPLFTCFNGELTGETINPVTLLKELGVPSRGIYGVQGNTHVPKLTTAAVNEDGRPTTWGDSIYDFFEQQLKTIDTATAPEMLPHGGSIAGPTRVRLLTVHPSGSIHYTLDGTAPNDASPKYASPIEVKPGQTLKTVAVREGLKPSRITTGRFVSGSERPVITTTKRSYAATLGKPFRAEFSAENTGNAQWFVGGKVGWHYRTYKGKRFNPPKHFGWLSIDSATGVLSGTPLTPGTYPIIVSCMTKPVGQGKARTSETGDAQLVVVRVAK